MKEVGRVVLRQYSCSQILDNSISIHLHFHTFADIHHKIRILVLFVGFHDFHEVELSDQEIYKFCDLDFS